MIAMAPGCIVRPLVLAAAAVLVGLCECRGLKLRHRPPRIGFINVNASNAAPAGQVAANLHGVGQQLASSHVEGRLDAADRDAAHVSLPRVYFLFLAVEKVSNIKIWNNFFAQATNTYYRAIVHCKTTACEFSVKGSVLELVPTVPSYYCSDLVSPMQQLISSALLKDKGGSAMDKFVFVSDSSLPAKPFSHVYARLVGRQGSDFCIFPTTEWADKADPQGVMEVAPKHHQWMVLNRQHAEKTYSLWSTGQGHDLMMRYSMNKLSYWPGMNNSYADGRNFGCLDEFWHMSAIWGPIQQRMGKPVDVDLALLNGGPLRVDPTQGWQGKCDTFVMWARYLDAPATGAPRDISPFKKFHMSLDKASLPYTGNDQRPGWWDTMSEHGLQAIRLSDFLFMRKFTDNPKLVDGDKDFAASFSRIVLR